MIPSKGDKRDKQDTKFRCLGDLWNASFELIIPLSRLGMGKLLNICSKMCYAQSMELPGGKGGRTASSEIGLQQRMVLSTYQAHFAADSTKRK